MGVLVETGSFAVWRLKLVFTVFLLVKLGFICWGVLVVKLVTEVL